MNELIYDGSHWNYPVDYAAMQQAGVVAVIGKSGAPIYQDDRLMVHSAGTKSVGMHFGNYYWADPTRDAVQQASHAINLADKSGAEFIGVDNEQWWADWTMWIAATQGKISMSSVPRVPAAQIDKTAHTILQHLRDYQPRPLLHYTSVGFINTYSRISVSWMHEFETWLAQYHKTGTPPDLRKHTVTWDELKAKWLPTTEPYYPSDWEKPVMWQWTGDRFAVDKSGYMDLSLWWNSSKTFAQWVGSTTPPTVPLPYTVQHLVNCTALNVRSAPSAQSIILKVLVPSNTVLIANAPLENTSWAKLYGEPGYVHSYYISK